jgi:peptidyl-prolyl isomerase G (cyclophilin G)
MSSTKVFFDIIIGSTAVGRIIFELFKDITPKTAENFRGLCTGEYGYGKFHKRKLHYKGSRFHKIVEDQYIQGGDFVYGNGSGGESIYGEYFKDENFQRRHACAGLLSMANKGRNSNSSQFLITVKPCPHLDGKNVVFGQVVDGMDIVRQISKLPTDFNQRPKVKIFIFDCGDFDTRRIHLIEDPFKETMEAILADRRKIEKVKIMGPEEAEEYKKTKKKSAFNILQEYSSGEENEGESENKSLKNRNILKLDEGDKEIDLKETGEDNLEYDEEEQIEGESDQEEYDEEDEEEEENETLQIIQSKLGESGLKKYLELKSKINEVTNLNMKAVQEENKKSQDPEWERKKIKEEYKNLKQEQTQKMIESGIPEDKLYTLNSINKCEIKSQKMLKKNKNEAFGWDVFNTDTLYRAYKKRLKNMPMDKSLYEDQMNNPGKAIEITEQRKHLLNADLEAQKQKRKVFSRRRAFYEEQDVNYINERNMNFNKKLQRFFGKEAAEIKANLERGTAL